MIWFASTLKLLPYANEEKHFRTDPDIPTRSPSLFIRISLLIVSKAEKISNKTKTIMSAYYGKYTISLETLSCAVSVECILWNPNWK